MCAGDVESLRRILSDDFTYVHRNGLMETRDVYLRRLELKEVAYSDATCEDVNTRAYGDAAVVTGRMRLLITYADGRPAARLHNRFLAVWIRRQGGWVCVAWNSTGIPDPAVTS